MVGEAAVTPWLAVDGLLSQFGRRRGAARQRYRCFVAEGVRQESIWTGLRQQIYLGDEEFVRMMQQKMTAADEMTIPRIQIRPPAPSLAAIAELHADRDKAIVAGYATGACSYRQIAEHFGLHLVTVGHIVRASLNTGILL